MPQHQIGISKRMYREARSLVRKAKRNPTARRDFQAAVTTFPTRSNWRRALITAYRQELSKGENDEQ